MGIGCGNAGPMLIGRDDERAALTGCVAAARGGNGSVTLVTGTAGMGKTALLGWLRANAPGLRVLAGAGAESEIGLPFAGLDQLLRPVLSARHRLSPAQRAALEGAFALGPPAAPDRFATYAASSRCSRWWPAGRPWW